jgi:hypothetical protein
MSITVTAGILKALQREPTQFNRLEVDSPGDHLVFTPPAGSAAELFFFQYQIINTSAAYRTIIFGAPVIFDDPTRGLAVSVPPGGMVGPIVHAYDYPARPRPVEGVSQPFGCRVPDGFTGRVHMFVQYRLYT